MKQTPFNLAEALAGKPVVCRNGTPIVSIFHDPGAGPGAVIIARYENSPAVCCYSKDGRLFNATESCLDLFMLEEEKPQPWTMEDVPMVARYRWKDWPADQSQGAPIRIDDAGIVFHSAKTLSASHHVSWKELSTECEHTTDGINWKPCTK